MTRLPQHVFVVDPGARRDLPVSGNRTTALRWAALLRRQGVRVARGQAWDGRDTDLLLALHARRSAASVARFRASAPGRPTVVACSGTDIYGSDTLDPAVLASLHAADAVIVLQPEALARLPADVACRAHVVLQSVSLPEPAEPPPDDVVAACVLANLRPVKDPLRAGYAVASLPPAVPLRVVLAGASLDADLEREAGELAGREPRFTWVGPLRRRQALQLLRASHLLVSSSLHEGGANAVSEAIVAGIPVVATRIPGSTGLLGADHPALFAPGDTSGLARWLARLARRPALRAQLAARSARLAGRLTPAAEAAALRAVLERAVESARAR